MNAAPRASIVIAFVVTVVACDGDGDEPAVEPFFPADYDASYTEARPCMPSGDHDLNNVRILVDAAARVPYEERMQPFPVGAVLLKEEYDFGDTTCEGELTQWTVMRRLAEGTATDTLDWAWQQVDADRNVVSEDLPRCIACHTGCGVPPDGYEGACAILQ
jgi:hypothetical protein